MFCNGCGASLGEGSQFCSRCGRPVAVAALRLSAKAPYLRFASISSSQLQLQADSFGSLQRGDTNPKQQLSLRSFERLSAPGRNRLLRRQCSRKALSTGHDGIVSDPKAEEMSTFMISVEREIAAKDKYGTRYRYRYMCSAPADGKGGIGPVFVELLPSNAH